MTAPPEPASSETPKRHRWGRLLVVGVVVGVAALAAAIVVPFHSETRELQVAPGAVASVDVSVPGPAWVTVRYEHPGAGPMMYGMAGPSGGMMVNHHGMTGPDSYSFATWGGTFRCWAGYETGSHGFGTTPVWVNMTWGLL